MSAGPWCSTLLPWVEFSKWLGRCYWRETGRCTDGMMKDKAGLVDGRVMMRGERGNGTWHISLFYLHTCRGFLPYLFSLLLICSLSIFLTVSLSLSSCSMTNLLPVFRLRYIFLWNCLCLVHFLDFSVKTWLVRAHLSFTWNCTSMWWVGPQWE